MSAIHQSRKDLRYLAQTLRGLLALDEELGEADSLEKLTQECRAELDKAATERLKAESDLAAMRETVTQAKAEADAVKAAAKNEAAKIVSDATDRAAAIDAEAKATEARLRDLESQIGDRQKQLEAISGLVAAYKK